jgi:hypothetical protein
VEGSRQAAFCFNKFLNRPSLLWHNLPMGNGKLFIMKKIFTLSFAGLFAALLFAGCLKRDYVDNSNYWYSKERGQVVFSSLTCNLFVVQTSRGYTVLESFGVNKPYEGDIVYGNFSSYGDRNILDDSSGTIFSVSVMDYWLTYIQAQVIMNDNCPLGRKF